MTKAQPGKASMLLVVRVDYSRPLCPYDARRALANALAELDLQAKPALVADPRQCRDSDIYIENLEIVGGRYDRGT